MGINGEGDGVNLGIQGEKLALYPFRVMVTSSRGEENAIRHNRAFTVFTITNAFKIRTLTDQLKN